MKVKIRQANQHDAEALADLVYLSAPTLFDQVFGADFARSFLEESLAQAAGQYGYENHWVAEYKQKPIGSISLWHTELPVEFHQATIRTIHQYFGLKKSLEVVTHMQQLTEGCSSVEETDLAVGHLAVDLNHQKSGVGKSLMAFAKQQAKIMDKACLIIDVERENTQAYQFYRKLGFSQYWQNEAQDSRFIKMRYIY